MTKAVRGRMRVARAARRKTGQLAPSGPSPEA